MSARDPRDAVHLYHERSTHRPDRFAPGPGRLDWATQPDPFRTYAGAPILELPLAGDDLSASWEQLHRPGAVAPRPLDRPALGAFLELALGLTAWKEFGTSRWALRANPSSGNLHPTEGYVLAPDTPGVGAGLYHYRSREHVLEHRWAPTADDARTLGGLLPAGGFLLGLSSIHWREAWKYGERAFRYCQHDAGHALATARYAAAVLGWSARLLEPLGDGDVATLLGLDREEDLEDLPAQDREHPDTVVLVGPPTAIPEGAARIAGAIDDLTGLARGGVWTGRPNALSPAHVPWPEIDTVAAATRSPDGSGHNRDAQRTGRASGRRTRGRRLGPGRRTHPATAQRGGHGRAHGSSGRAVSPPSRSPAPAPRGPPVGHPPLEATDPPGAVRPPGRRSRFRALRPRAVRLGPRRPARRHPAGVPLGATRGRLPPPPVSSRERGHPLTGALRQLPPGHCRGLRLQPRDAQPLRGQPGGRGLVVSPSLLGGGSPGTGPLHGGGGRGAAGHGHRLLSRRRGARDPGYRGRWLPGSLSFTVGGPVDDPRLATRPAYPPDVQRRQ